MAILIRRKRLSSNDIEKTVLTGLITSTRVLEAIQPLADPNLFTLDVSRIISRWCFNYYTEYGKSPSDVLEAIFIAEKAKLKESDQQLVSEFLRTISRDYMENPPNEEYIAAQAVEYLRKQKILNLAKEMQGVLELGGEASKAEALMSSYKSVGNNVPIAKNMFSASFMSSVFDAQETPLLEFSGALGRFIGPLQRGYLFGLIGKGKVGKTTWLMRFAAQAVMRKLRVVFFSLEMTAEQMGLRFAQHFGSYGKPNDIAEFEYRIPALDCRLNQENNCTLTVRTCREEMPREEYQMDQLYLPCSACRYQSRSSFTPRIYYVKEVRPTINRFLARRQIDQFQMQYGPDALQIVAYPAYSATMKDISAELDILEYGGFIPDVIIIDYPDILAPENFKADKLDQINEIWMKLKAMSQTRKCLVFAPTQGSRQSFKKSLIDPTDVPWDIRKLAHVDLMVGLNQTDYEKKEQITRLNIIAHRWEEYLPNRVYVSLQQLKIAQPELDGFIKIYNPSK